LDFSRPLAALLGLDAARYPQRVRVLRREIDALIADSADDTFGASKYSLGCAGDFI
jgi:hypothetical protein